MAVGDMGDGALGLNPRISNFSFVYKIVLASLSNSFWFPSIQVLV